jgi:hypothetical protein
MRSRRIMRQARIWKYLIIYGLHNLLRIALTFCLQLYVQQLLEYEAPIGVCSWSCCLRVRDLSW